ERGGGDDARSGGERTPQPQRTAAPRIAVHFDLGSNVRANRRSESGRHRVTELPRGMTEVAHAALGDRAAVAETQMPLDRRGRGLVEFAVDERIEKAMGLAAVHGQRSSPFHIDDDDDDGDDDDAGARCTVTAGSVASPSPSR